MHSIPQRSRLKRTFGSREMCRYLCTDVLSIGQLLLRPKSPSRIKLYRKPPQLRWFPSLFDCIRIVRACGESLDGGYLERSAAKLGIAALLVKALVGS